jgi:GNAT superfamily N-acetyltransferase
VQPAIHTIRLPFAVPYYAQVASHELARAIFDAGLDARLDPRWKESGAETVEEYAYWSGRACGPACVKMCVEALGGERRSLMDWVRAGLARQGYLVEKDHQGNSVEVGWLHRALAELIQAAGFQGTPQAIALDDFPRYLKEGCLLIASVSYKVGQNARPVTHKGGHLVVVIGASLVGDKLEHIVINNPSGRVEELRANARIPGGRFRAGYSGRCILITQPAVSQ